LLSVLTTSVRIALCRLRHSGSLERDGSPIGSFPTEWLGSRQEYRVWAKHSRSIITLLIRQDWVSTGTLSECPDVAKEAKGARLSRYAELRWSLATSPSPKGGYGFLTRSNTPSRISNRKKHTWTSHYHQYTSPAQQNRCTLSQPNCVVSIPMQPARSTSPIT